jgi:glucan phosphoethanolaminetransferase (alkaline phosphatase superfamily)
MPKWLWLALAVAFGMGAAFAFMVYLANGLVIGDLIGLTGREHDIEIAYHRSSAGFLFSIILQFAVAGALLNCTKRESSHQALRIFGILLASLALTLACGVMISFGFRALH